MTFKKFRLNKTCIYESDKQSLEKKARMASLLGYPFITDGEHYYQVSLKQFKTKPDILEIHMVDVELVDIMKK